MLLHYTYHVKVSKLQVNLATKIRQKPVYATLKAPIKSSARDVKFVCVNRFPQLNFSNKIAMLQEHFKGRLLNIYAVSKGPSPKEKAIKPSHATMTDRSALLKVLAQSEAEYVLLLGPVNTFQHFHLASCLDYMRKSQAEIAFMHWNRSPIKNQRSLFPHVYVLQNKFVNSFFNKFPCVVKKSFLLIHPELIDHVNIPKIDTRNCLSLYYVADEMGLGG